MRILFSIMMGVLLLGPVNQAVARDFPFLVPPFGPTTDTAEIFTASPRWIVKEMNMRDAGGWTLPRRGTVPYGLLYRSRELFDLQDDARDVIKGIGLKTLIDFRTEKEREESPDDPGILAQVDRVIHLEVDYNRLDTEYEVMKFLNCTPDLLTNPEYRTPDPVPTPEQLAYATVAAFIDRKVESGYIESREAIVDLLTPDYVNEHYTNPDGRYIYVLSQNIDKFKEFLNVVKELESPPLLFHCSEGKDRTGIANAILLNLLNVPDKQILEDFLSSNDAAEEVLGYPFDVVQKANMVALLKVLPLFLGKFDFNLNDLSVLKGTFEPAGVLVPRGSAWQYNDFGSYFNGNKTYAHLTGINAGEWKQAGFDDVQWRAGTAPLGFSAYSYDPLVPDGSDPENGGTCDLEATKYPENPLTKGEVNSDDINTTVACTNAQSFTEGCDIGVERDNTRIPTYYFRHEFNLDDPMPDALVLWAHLDDGAIVYLNGEEVARLNMPEGFSQEDSLKYSGKGSFMEGYAPFFLNSDKLRLGTNLLAIETHQEKINSKDMLFDVELVRAGGTSVTGTVKGPDGLTISKTDLLIEDITPHRVAYAAPGSDGSPEPQLTPGVAENNGVAVYQQYRVSTGMDGKFTKTLAPGSYRISSMDERFLSASTTFEVSAEESRKSVTHRLDWPLSVAEKIEKDTDWSYWPSTWNQAIAEEVAGNWNRKGFDDASWAATEGAVEFDLSAPASRQLFPPAFTLYTGDGEIIQEMGVPKIVFFRKTFDLAHEGSVTSIQIEHKIDDGALFYLNGIEVARFNMPEGPLDEDSMAASKTDVPQFNSMTLQGEQLDALVRGENVLAVALYGFSSKVQVIDESGTMSEADYIPLLFNGCLQDEEESSVYGDCRIPGQGLDAIDSFKLGIGDAAESFLTSSGKSMELLERKVAVSGDMAFDLSVKVTSSSVQLAGKVVDASGNAVPDVRVEIENTDVYGITDSRGGFNMYTPAGPATLLVHLPLDPDLRVLKHRLEVPAAGVGDVKLTLLAADELPDYDLSRMAEPQVIAAGISPSIIESGDAETLVTLLAVVRPGELPVQGVEMQSKQGGSFVMEKTGELGNGDELWTFQIFLAKGTELKYISEDVITGIVARDARKVSPAFPLYMISNRSGADVPETGETLPYSNLDSTIAKRPQLIACGQSPAIVSMDNYSAQILAIVRPGENELERVTLKKGDCFGCTTLMNVAGRLPNGDYIYTGSMDEVDPGYHNEERDILKEGWSVTATDNKGGESNACFHLE